MNGRGWLDYKQGPKVRFGDLAVGRIYLMYSPMFDSYNTIQIIDVDPPVNGKRLGRPLVYWSYHTEEGTVADIHAFWEDSGQEFYKPLFKVTVNA
jgi:hypothetical protein